MRQFRRQSFATSASRLLILIQNQSTLVQWPHHDGICMSKPARRRWRAALERLALFGLGDRGGHRRACRQLTMRGIGLVGAERYRVSRLDIRNNSAASRRLRESYSPRQYSYSRRLLNVSASARRSHDQYRPCVSPSKPMAPIRRLRQSISARSRFDASAEARRRGVAAMPEGVFSRMARDNKAPSALT